MSDPILLRFLSAGLINVGGDDTKLEKLRETANDLAVALKKKPSKTSSYALIAFDPTAPVDDPVMIEAAEALKKRWPTYVNTFAGAPIAVFRALLLDALFQAADDDRVGVAFVTSARNMLPFTEAEHEREIWTEAVAELEQRVDARAESEWATPETMSAPAMKYSAPAAFEIEPLSLSIDTETLSSSLTAAAIPNGTTPANRYWLHGDPTNWGPDFGRLAAKAIASAIDDAAKESERESIDISKPLQALSEAVSTYVGETLKVIGAATFGLQRRTNLIWWKETLFSPSAQISYRRLPVSAAAALMALDLHQQVPIYSPLSVAAFLQEAVLTLPSMASNEKLALRSLLNEALGLAELRPLREAARQLTQEPSGRGPILALLGWSGDELRLDDARFQVMTGIPADTLLTASQWATWLFREFQAVYATQDSGKAKKIGSKT